jgi:hypothetical protein
VLTVNCLTLATGCTKGTATGPSVVHGHGITAEYGEFHGVVTAASHTAASHTAASHAATPRVSIYIRAAAQVGRGGPRLSVPPGHRFSVKLLFGSYVVYMSVGGKHI